MVMSNLTKILSTAVLGLTVAFGASLATAATTGTTITLPDSGHSSYEYLSTDGSFTNGTGPDDAYIMIDFIPSAISAATVASETGKTITNFWKNNTPGGNTGFANPGFLFEGFMIKAGNETLVGFFNTAISSLYWNTLFTSDFLDSQEAKWCNAHPEKPCKNPQNAMSHVVYYNITGDIPQIPVPAALWLFAPALLGLMGFRRRNNKA